MAEELNAVIGHAHIIDGDAIDLAHQGSRIRDQRLNLMNVWQL